MIILRLSGNAAVALTAGSLLIIMPGSLMNPLSSCTESWFAFFLCLGTFLICLAVDTTNKRWLRIIIFSGFVAFAAASFIRPQGMLASLVAMLLCVRFLPRERWFAAAGCAASYLLFPLSWLLLRLAYVGSFDLGPSEGDFGINVYIRATRISSQIVDAPGLRMGVIELMKIIVSYPVATLKTIYSDCINLFVNPGTNHLFGYYLGLFSPIPIVTFGFRLWTISVLREL